MHNIPATNPEQQFQIINMLMKCGVAAADTISYNQCYHDFIFGDLIDQQLQKLWDKIC